MRIIFRVTVQIEGIIMSQLYFRPGKMKGFTAVELADKKQGYAIPIRELLQNSLDASREAGHKCEVNIYIETIAKTDIPHIKEYEDVLRMAVKTHDEKNSLNDIAKQDVDAIKRALNQKEIKVLLFMDNGTGMNQEKIDALLSEASMHDDEKSGGSFGVGNLCSYSLSSLRYVLYATKYKGKALFTGSPILAGYRDDDAQRGNRGQIVAEKPECELDPKFIYPTEFPKFIQPKMDGVDHGTIVSILGLTEDWNEAAEYAIASNFFHAIEHDDLSIKIHAGHKETSIDTERLKSLIEKEKDGKHAKKENILSGRSVYQAWSAIKDGNQESITSISGEKIYVHIKHDQDMPRSAIVLIRNGMVVARHDSMLSRAMEGLRKTPNVIPFTAVIDVDQEDAPELFSLVRGAEGPYHNKLVKKRLSPEREKTLQLIFEKLSGEIKKHLELVSREPTPVPLFEIPNESATEHSGKNMPDGQTNKPKPMPTPRPDPTSDPSHKPNPDPRARPEVTSRDLQAKTAVRYVNEDDGLIVVLRVVPKIYDDRDETYFSVYLCEDNDNRGNSTILDFVEVEMDGKYMNIGESGNQVNLGELEKGAKYSITAKLKKPADFGRIKVALMPVFRLKRAKKPT